jgi:hypothetical protein
MLSLLTILLVSAPAVQSSVAAVVGVRTGAQYWTVFVRPAVSRGHFATVSRGLLVPTVGGLMFVDVVSNCSQEDPQQHLSPQQYLSIRTVAGLARPAPCTPVPDSFDPPKMVKVLFVGHRYISVYRYSESFSGRGSWYLDTSAWGEGTPIPMARLLPRELVAEVDSWAAKQRKDGTAQALREGLAGDAAPCLYPDPDPDLWAIARSQRQWVVMTLLKSSCITYEEATPLAVPDALVDRSRNQNPGVTLLPSDGPELDVVVSPDGGLAVVWDGGAVLLQSVHNGLLREASAVAQIPLRHVTSDSALVMVQWFDSPTLSRWRAALEEAMGNE